MNPPEPNDINEYVHHRLERIELKMDRLVEAVTQIARLEERIGQSLDKTSRLEEELHHVRERCTALEKGHARDGVYIGMVERTIYHVIGLAAAALVGAFFAYAKFGGP